MQGLFQSTALSGVLLTWATACVLVSSVLPSGASTRQSAPEFLENWRESLGTHVTVGYCTIHDAVEGPVRCVVYNGSTQLGDIVLDPLEDESLDWAQKNCAGAPTTNCTVVVSGTVTGFVEPILEDAKIESDSANIRAHIVTPEQASVPAHQEQTGAHPNPSTQEQIRQAMTAYAQSRQAEVQRTEIPQSPPSSQQQFQVHPNPRTDVQRNETPQSAPSSLDGSPAGFCMYAAEKLFGGYAELRDKGTYESELDAMVSGHMALKDILTWMIRQLYTTLRYVPPQDVPSRMRGLCLAQFNQEQTQPRQNTEIQKTEVPKGPASAPEGVNPAARFCILAAEKLPALWADLRDKGKYELEEAADVTRAGGPMAERDILTWMLGQVYSTLRYVPPNEVPSRMRELCLAQFK